MASRVRKQARGAVRGRGRRRIPVPEKIRPPPDSKERSPRVACVVARRLAAVDWVVGHEGDGMGADHAHHAVPGARWRRAEGT